jgi:4-hydroxy-tetrahydrodipicolinate synthase
MAMISGSIVALVTPMTDSGALDWQRLDDLIEMHIEQGTNAIVAVGTTGESSTIKVDDHLAVIKRIVDQVNGRVPVIAGTGANATKEAIELTEKARDLKADACLLVTPYYNKPTQEGLYQHYLATSKVAIPQILYNVPGRTACDLLPQTVARLVGVPNIYGIKEATGDLQRGQQILDICGDKMAVYSGDDETAMDFILMGAKGDISVTANVAPALMSEMCAAALAGNKEKAQALNKKLLPLHQKLFVESNPIPVKWALYEMGLMGKGIRLPLTVLDEKYQPEVRAALAAAGLL